MDELIEKYIEKFDDSPLRIGEILSDEENIKRLEYCIANNITVDELAGESELDEDMLI